MHAMSELFHLRVDSGHRIENIIVFSGDNPASLARYYALKNAWDIPTEKYIETTISKAMKDLNHHPFDVDFRSNTARVNSPISESDPPYNLDISCDYIERPPTPYTIEKLQSTNIKRAIDSLSLEFSYS